MTGGMFLFRLTLIAALPSFTKDHQAFSTKVFTSPDDQFWVNSTIIEGAHEVMLVDAQLTKTSAEKVLRKSGRPRSRCPSSTLPMSMPIISLASRSSSRRIRQ